MNSSSFIFGIAGPSNSGKSTLETYLKDKFEENIAFVSFDDFFVGLRTLPGRTTSNWEHPDLYRWDEFARVISDLKDGKETTFKPYSFESKRDGVIERIIMPKPIIVVLGFMVLRSPHINTMFDAKIYIDIPAEEMVRRRLARAAERPMGAWNNEQYVKEILLPATSEFVAPQLKVADFVVDGMLPRNQVADKVIEIIDSHK